MGAIATLGELGHGQWPAKGTTVDDRLRELGPSPDRRHRRARLIRVSWDVFHFLCIAVMSLTFLALENDALSCTAYRDTPTSSFWPRFSKAPAGPPPHCAAWSAYAVAIWREATVSPLEAGCACFTNFFIISMCGNSPLAWLAGAAFASVTDRQWSNFVQGIVDKWGHQYDGYASYAPPAR